MQEKVIMSIKTCRYCGGNYDNSRLCSECTGECSETFGDLEADKELDFNSDPVTDYDPEDWQPEDDYDYELHE
jgi:hypothetical protein